MLWNRPGRGWSNTAPGCRRIDGEKREDSKLADTEKQFDEAMMTARASVAKRSERRLLSSVTDLICPNLAR